MSKYEEVKNGIIFPVGEPLLEMFSKYFIGQASFKVEARGLVFTMRTMVQE